MHNLFPELAKKKINSKFLPTRQVLRLACYGPNGHKMILHERTSIGELESAIQSQNDKLCLRLPSFRSSIHRSVAEVELLAELRTEQSILIYLYPLKF